MRKSISMLACGAVAFAALLVAGPVAAESPAPRTTDVNGRAYFDEAPVLPEVSGMISAEDIEGTTVSSDGLIHPMAGRCGKANKVVVHATVGWGNAQKGPCYIMGLKGSKISYRWDVFSLIGKPIACMQVGGYNSSKKFTWYSAGCGRSGNATVPWGEVAASHKVRGKAGKTAGTSATVYWR